MAGEIAVYNFNSEFFELCFNGSRYNLSCYMFHGCLKRTCILLLIYGIVCKCQYPLDFDVFQFSKIFCLVVLSMVERGVLQSPVVSVDLFIVFPVNFCIMCFGALFFATYTFRIAMSYQ